MLKRLLLALLIVAALLPATAHAQSPTPTTPLGFSPLGALTADASLYPSAARSAAPRVLPQGTAILNLLARTEDGWLWVLTGEGLGWLAPDAPMAIEGPVPVVPLFIPERPASGLSSIAPVPTPTLEPEPALVSGPSRAVEGTGALVVEPPGGPFGRYTWPALLLGLGVLTLGLAVGATTAYWRRQMHAEATQRASVEAQLREVIQYSDDAVLMTDTEGRVVEATAPAVSLLSQPAVAGQSLAALFDIDPGPLIEDALIMGYAHREGVGLKDNSRRLINIEARTVNRQGRLYARLLLREVSATSAEEEELARRRELALYDIATTISRSLERDKVLEIALDRLMRLSGADAGAIFIRNGYARLWAAQGFSDDFCARIDAVTPDTGLLGQVLHSATPWLMPSLPYSPDSLAQALTGEGVASLAVVPLLAHGEEAGVILLGARRAQAFSSRDVPLFEVIGAHIGVAVENARLFRELGDTVGSLEQVKRFSESVFQNMTNGIITLDGLGCVTSLNHAAEQMLKLNMDDTVGQTLEAVLQAPGSLSDMMQHVLRLGTTFAGHELVVTRADGQSIPLRLSIAPLRNDKNAIVGAVVVFDDLTEQRTIEEERQRLDRLALLGEMTAVLAHELRNPLASISSGIQYLAQQTPPDQPNYEALALVLKESTRLNQLLEDILEMSRTPRLQLGLNSITDMLDDILARWYATAALHQIRLVKDYDPATPIVRCDPLRVEQAMSNLIINAIQAMPGGGVLTVRTRLESDPDSGLAFLAVDIGDTGPGVPSAILSKLFTPFFTTKGNGTGLGLTITQRVINEHGGSVAVDSVEGHGAVFTVRLPATP